MNNKLIITIALSFVVILIPALSLISLAQTPNNSWATVCDNQTAVMYAGFQPNLLGKFHYGTDIDAHPNGCSHRVYFNETGQTPLQNVLGENNGVRVILSLRPGFYVYTPISFTSEIALGVWYRKQDNTEDIDWYNITINDSTDWHTIEFFINQQNVNKVQLHYIFPLPPNKNDYIELDNIYVIPEEPEPTPTNTPTNTPTSEICIPGADYVTTLHHFVDSDGSYYNEDYALGPPDGLEAELYGPVINQDRYFSYSLAEVYSGTFQITRTIDTGHVWRARYSVISVTNASYDMPGWESASSSYVGKIGSYRIALRGWPTGGGWAYLDSVEFRLINGCDEPTPTPTPTLAPTPIVTNTCTNYDLEMTGGSGFNWLQGLYVNYNGVGAYSLSCTEGQCIEFEGTPPYSNTISFSGYVYVNAPISTTLTFNNTYFDVLNSTGNFTFYIVPWEQSDFNMLMTSDNWFVLSSLTICGNNEEIPTPTPTITPTATSTITPTATLTPTETKTPYPTTTDYPTATPYPTYTDYPTPSPQDTPTYSPPGTINPTPIFTPIPTPSVITDAFYSDFYYSLDHTGTDCYWLIPPVPYINFIGIQVCFEWYNLRLIAWGIEVPIYWLMAVLGTLIVYRVFIKTAG